MRPFSFSLVWLLATLTLAEFASHNSTHPGPRLPRKNTPLHWGKRTRRASGSGGNRTEWHGRPKVLRYPLQQAQVNGTELQSRRVAQREPAVGKRWGGRLAKRENQWNWKQLEDYRGFLYFIEIEIGEPPQTVTLTPDTGSFETWVNPNCENSASPILCEVNGAYLPGDSALSEASEETFQFQYGSGWADGQYYEDRMYFRRGLVDEDVGIMQRFGMAWDSTYAVSGILGLGYGYGYSLGYNNVLDSLAENDVINAQIYSVALGPIGKGSSEIVFGGVNVGRYRGHLRPVPIWPSVHDQPLNWVHYWVNLTSLSLTTPTGTTRVHRSTSAPVNALVDTGSTYSLLPAAVAEALADALGAWKEVGEWKVDCALRDVAGSVDFGFGDVVIRVPYSDFLLKMGDSCSMGVQGGEEGSEGEAILGDTFLRGAYVVFDQVSHNLWMANHEDCRSEVQEVGLWEGDPGDLWGLC